MACHAVAQRRRRMPAFPKCRDTGDTLDVVSLLLDYASRMKNGGMSWTCDPGSYIEQRSGTYSGFALGALRLLL
jgi:hypothetical protein